MIMISSADFAFSSQEERLQLLKETTFVIWQSLGWERNFHTM